MNNDKFSFPRQWDARHWGITCLVCWWVVGFYFKDVTVKDDSCLLPVFCLFALFFPDTCLPDLRLGTKTKRLNFKAFWSHSKKVALRTSWMEIIIFAENWCLLFFFNKTEILGSSSHLKCISRKELLNRTSHYSRSPWDDSA